MKKKLARIFYWLASRLDSRWPKYPDAIKEDVMIYGTGFVKRIALENVYLNQPNK